MATMQTDTPVFITVKQFANRVGVSVVTVHNLINDGRVRAVRVGSMRRIPVEEFERVQREGC